ncbi:hypothetical protein AALP_AA4G163000 [Arabis alpina]|uniref:MATH domain-containing protein n=1 Tax=Arabis alpina TaxID=50452 RepID=A0A087H3N5_ARAAL|nr:hypothetical protein AALP_AA4G163000 [Arabis alpina]
MSNQKPSFRSEIENLSKKESIGTSQAFVSGGCEWNLSVSVYPIGWDENYLSVYLQVANPRSLQTGWRRSVDFYFVVSNQSGEELYKTGVERYNFDPKNLLWGFETMLRFPKIEKLIIDVYITYIEVVTPNKKETVEIHGFQILTSQVTLVKKIFAEHPDIAKDFKPTNQMVKTSYMNVLLNLIETLDKPLKNLSETELRNAHIKLCELMEVDFKVDWLKSKLEKVSLERKKINDSDGYHVQQLEERIKNLELMELGSLKSKLEEVSSEMKNLQLMVSNLKVELDKKKAKVFVDGFLLVDEV